MAKSTEFSLCNRNQNLPSLRAEWDLDRSSDAKLAFSKSFHCLSTWCPNSFRSVHVLPVSMPSLGKAQRITNNPPEGAGITARRECMAPRYRKCINRCISHDHRMTSCSTTAEVHVDGHKGLHRLPRVFTSCRQHENQHPNITLNVKPTAT